MVTEAAPSRRRALALLAGTSLASLAPFSSVRAAGMPATPAATLLAAWQDAGRERIGEVHLAQGHWALRCALDVPTRAHGLLAEPGGGVLAVARRPGDWLLRWQPRSGRTQWQWVEDERRFNGHVIASADGRRLWTTETELEDAQGLLGLRDARSLEKTAEWPTHGRDPHQLMALPRALGQVPAGALVVANGGIPSLPETGRAKQRLHEMDASLVLLDARDGALLGQWRLADRWLSIRHLAWDAASGRLGIALQAEHPDAQARAQAPVLAVWDGRSLWAATGQPALAGYGGDIVALPGGGFAVSCPRADTVALYDAQGAWRGNRPFEGAYALARQGADWWVAGVPQVRHWPAGDLLRPPAADTALRWDNHWVAAA